MSSTSSSRTGAEVVAKTLKGQGVDVVFGIVGIPVVEVAEAIIAEGIKFIGFRNEQSLSYAAGAYGYLTGRPGVCLVVSGPGVVHAMSGIVNSQINCWPMLLIGGSSHTYQEGLGSFQEFDQVKFCQSNTKYSIRPPSISQIPQFIDRAIKISMYGRPGPVYFDLPADFIQGSISFNLLNFPERKAFDPPKSLADLTSIKLAIELLSNAKRPLIIVGKGAAFARAEQGIKEFIEKTGIPFIPTPMGKGVMSDTHPLCMAAARSKALVEADVILLLGARLNWILHFGLPPKFDKNVKFIQVDIYPEEHFNNSQIQVSLFGHLSLVMTQLIENLPNSFKYPANSEYLQSLKRKVSQNLDLSNKKFQEDSIPMTYHRAYWEIKKRLPQKDLVFVSEGAKTMDLARTIFDMHEPRCRLDAGTFGTMGIGIGSAIAGFDLKTYNSIPINNLPSTALLPNVRYDLIADAAGGKGYFVRTPKELGDALDDALLKLLEYKCVVINVMVQPQSEKTGFAWVESTKPKL
ncbi:4995_t:CDS:2 [Diversispora eburnea]|uniref:2-hydroxyacyl-CoA lyase n=1 Tax=Diversispora eburnea TaxID=1213867 RepID=A0A9N9FI93_9GLOM|nr:4995_t:CDS:2 [Diversispora eburnea]